MGKPAIMMLMDSITTGANMTVQDVVNSGKTCKAPPALPSDAVKKDTRVYAVHGSPSTKVGELIPLIC